MPCSGRALNNAIVERSVVNPDTFALFCGMQHPLTFVRLPCALGYQLVALAVGCLLLSCSGNQTYRGELAEIIVQDFNDYPTLNVVKPVYAYASWVVGKDSTFHQTATNSSYWAPPLTPDDTVLIYAAELPELRDKLFRGEKLALTKFRKTITQPYGGALLDDLEGVTLITENQVCSRLKASGLPEEHCTNTFYVFSEPVCHPSGSRCLIYVDKLAGWDSAGWRIIYEKQGTEWVRAEVKMLWVS